MKDKIFEIFISLVLILTQGIWTVVTITLTTFITTLISNNFLCVLLSTILWLYSGTQILVFVLLSTVCIKSIREK